MDCYYIHNSGDLSIIETYPTLSKMATPLLIPTIGKDIALKFLLKMNELRIENVLCDITLQSDDGTNFPVHKLVLSAASRYFAAMFQTNMAEKQQLTITMKGINACSLQSLIEFAYTSKIHVDIENVFSLLTAANMLCFEDVEESCVDFLRQNLNTENCVDICTMADMINCEELHRVATIYVSRNFRQIVRGINFFSLTPIQLQNILNNDSINVSSESEVYEAVMTWVTYDLDGREEYLPALLIYVRFALMSRKYLLDRVLHENLIMRQETCRNIVLKALDHHLLPERIIANSHDYCLLPRKQMEKNMYVVGGGSNGKALNTVECFDFLTSTWQPVSSMLMPRMHVSTAVLDGILYAIGGISDHVDLSTCEKYDPATELWTPVASLQFCRGALSVTVVDGWLYAFGGTNGKEALHNAEQYDPFSNTWTCLPNMRLPRSHFDVAELHGRIYAVGGYCGISEVERCEYYDPPSGKWFEITGLNKSRMNHAVVSCKKRLYVLGGKNSMGLLNNIEKYNPDLNMWLVIKSKVCLSLGMNLCLGYNVTCDCDDVFVVGGTNETEEERNQVTKISLKSPDYLIQDGVPMVENRSFPGIVFL